MSAHNSTGPVFDRPAEGSPSCRIHKQGRRICLISRKVDYDELTPTPTDLYYKNMTLTTREIA